MTMDVMHGGADHQAAADDGPWDDGTITKNSYSYHELSLLILDYFSQGVVEKNLLAIAVTMNLKNQMSLLLNALLFALLILSYQFAAQQMMKDWSWTKQ